MGAVPAIVFTLLARPLPANTRRPAASCTSTHESAEKLNRRRARPTPAVALCSVAPAGAAGFAADAADGAVGADANDGAADAISASAELAAVSASVARGIDAT